MMDLFKRNRRECNIYSPVDGICIPLEQVPDEMFANKVLGDGVGLDFDGEIVYSPCDGKVVMIAKTKHAIGLQTKNKMDILLHIGLDTVTLKGKGFEMLVEEGMNVTHTTPLIKIDRAYMNTKQMNLISCMVITNMDDFDLIISKKGKISKDEILMISTKKKR